MASFTLFNDEIEWKVSPCGAQIHSKCFPVFWCCYVVLGQRQLDGDHANQWTSGDARGADSPERELI